MAAVQRRREQRRPDQRARDRRRRRRRWAVPAVGAAASGLIAAGVLLPQPRAVTAVDVEAATAVATPTSALSGGAGVPFGSVALFPAPVPPPMPGFQVPRPAVVPQRLPRPFVPTGAPARTSPPPAQCGGFGTPRRIVPGVTPGTGSASLDWRADQHTEVEGYRVQAVSQQLVSGTQPAPVQVLVAQPAGCVPVTTRVTGLTSGVYYVFWLEEAQRDKASGLLRYVQVGTTAPVRIR